MLVFGLNFTVVILSNSLDSVEVMGPHFRLFLHLLLKSIPASLILFFFDNLEHSLLLSQLYLLLPGVLVLFDSISLKKGNLSSPLHSLVNFFWLNCELVGISLVALNRKRFVLVKDWLGQRRNYWISETGCKILKQVLLDPFFGLSEMERSRLSRIELV